MTQTGISMTGPEIRAFLESQRELHVATVNADGSPHVVAVWFAFVNDQLAFWGQRSAAKIRNLRRDPRMTISVAAGNDYAEIRGVMIRATAELVEQPVDVEAIGRAVLERNFAAAERPDAGQLTAGGNRIAVRVKMDRSTSWDFGKKTIKAPQA